MERQALPTSFLFAFLVVQCSKSERTTNQPPDSAARPILGPMWRLPGQGAASPNPTASNPSPTPPFTSWSLTRANPCPHQPLSPNPRNWRGEAHLIMADASLSASWASGQTHQHTENRPLTFLETAVVSLLRAEEMHTQTSDGLLCVCISQTPLCLTESVKSGITAPISQETSN